MKILNLYAGIGGNRKLWEGYDITSVEKNPSIAEIYKDFYPSDNVIIGDAHQYLLEHFKEYDFIWSSPPCPTHSVFNFLNNERVEENIMPKYPDMRLYEEIILLKTWYSGMWVIENVKSYYEPLIRPQFSGRHYFWSNFFISDSDYDKKIRNDKGYVLQVKMEAKGIQVMDFHGYDGDKRTLINNAIEPKLGLHILNCAYKMKQMTIA